MRVFSSVSRLSLSASAVAISTVLVSPALAGTVAAPPAAPAPPPEVCQNIAQSAAKQDCATRSAAQTDANANQGDLATSPTRGGVANAQASNPNEANIVVTGSRLHRDERTSVDPVQIIDPNASSREGRLDTAEMLQASPLAQGSTQITSILSTNFVINGGEGVENVDLRGLGPNRTLVLLNGRRAGPAGTRGGVAAFDLNVIPQDVIQSVEVLKTGASSVYGSDAVAGVVNIITRKDIRGIQVRLTDTEPFKVGGGEVSLTGIAGMGLGSRGHVMILGNYFKQQALTRGERGFLGCETENVTSQATGQRADPINPNTGQPYCGTFPNDVIFVTDFAPYFGRTNLLGPPVPTKTPGVTTRRPITAIEFDRPGDNLSKFLTPLGTCPPTNTGPFGEPLCLTVPSGFFPVGAYDATGLALEHLYNPQLNQDSVIPETKRYTVYGEASYDITDDVSLFFEGLYNRRQTKTTAHRQLFFPQFTGNSILPYFYCDQTLTPGCQFSSGDPLNTQFSGDQLLEPIVIAPFNSSTDVKYWRGVVGAHANLSKILPNGAVDFYFQHSDSNGDYNRDIIFRDAVEFGVAEFRTQTCAGTLTAIRHVPCIDINYTDPRVLAGNFTPQERAFLFGESHGNTRYKQDGGELSVTGDVLRLPYGAVKMAIGADLRRDSINDVPGEVRDPNLQNNIWGSTTSGITAGYERTTEGFGEIEIPLLKNLSFARDLSLNASGRVTSVYAHRSDGVSQSNNGNFTYKVGANYAPTNWLRFRGTYGTSFRSPALFEEFLSNETGFLNQSPADPCIHFELSDNSTLQKNCAAAGIPSGYQGAGPSFVTSSGGGVGHLQPETSKALTLSAIFTPDAWLWSNAQFSFAVDYSDIRVKNEITQLGAQNILLGCYTSTNFPTDPFCSLFTRSATNHNILTVSDPYLNIDQQHNKALDFTLRFRQGLGNLGTLSLLGEMSYQLTDKFTLFRGITTSNNGHAGDPKWVSQINLSWVKAPFTVTYGLNLIAGTSDLTGDNGNGLQAIGGPNLTPQNCLATASAFALRGGPYCPIYKLPRVAYHSISVEVQATKDVSFLFGIANLFDKDPPLVSTVGTPISAFAQVPLLGSYYDYLGRRFFVSIKAALPTPHHAAPLPPVAIPVPPPPSQTCADGSVVAAGAACPVPPPAPVAPPPPPPAQTKGERG